MKIKVGQWVRKSNGVFYQLQPIDMYTNWTVDRVKDTPQELIEVGDLIFDLNNIPFIVQRDSYGNLVMNKNDMIYLEQFIYDITKILTPNSVGGYDLQWEETK